MSANIPLIVFISLAIAVSAVVYSSSKKARRSNAPLPPGPKGLPLVGNISDVPRSQPWIAFAKLGDKYGGMVYLNALGKSMVIVNDSNVATEMLDKKGKIYSDRPTMIMAGELVGWNRNPGLSQFDRDGQWSEYRRNFAQYMGSRGKVVESFSDTLQEGARKFLKRLSESPDNWLSHIHMYAASNILFLAYGYKVEHEDDKFLAIVSKAMGEFSALMMIGAYFVDIFPILRYIPAWFPGAEWKRKVPEYKADMNRMSDVPFEWAKEQLKDSIANPSFVHARLSNEEELTPLQIYRIKMTASSMYGGGTDTTVSGIQSFVLAMILFPSTQAKAQAEIDEATGSDRLPTLEDRSSLPYVEALFWETLRFYPFTPLAVPHVAREDDVHNGYFIPKGTMVIPNVWRFMKDENKYHNPDVFSPERFLASKGNTPEEDPRNYIFGFGRRICPGRHLGDASMWLAITSILATFRISPAVKDGKPVLPKPSYKDGAVIHLEPFECAIKPRSAASIESLTRGA